MSVIVHDNKASQFANDFLNNLKIGKLNKEHITIRSKEFSHGIEELHRDRFCMYLKYCGCFLMNRRLDAIEEVYHG